ETGRINMRRKMTFVLVSGVTLVREKYAGHVVHSEDCTAECDAWEPPCLAFSWDENTGKCDVAEGYTVDDPDARMSYSSITAGPVLYFIGFHERPKRRSDCFTAEDIDENLENEIRPLMLAGAMNSAMITSSAFNTESLITESAQYGTTEVATLSHRDALITTTENQQETSS
ncbi:hypothetical protein PMAYCL1PPCAC_07891, partial [Pristionchus mayeri]